MAERQSFRIVVWDTALGLLIGGPPESIPASAGSPRRGCYRGGDTQGNAGGVGVLYESGARGEKTQFVEEERFVHVVSSVSRTREDLAASRIDRRARAGGRLRPGSTTGCSLRVIRRPAASVNVSTSSRYQAARYMHCFGFVRSDFATCRQTQN